MPQDEDIVRRYVAAEHARTLAAVNGDLAAFADASREWASMAVAYCDDLAANNRVPPAGLREAASEVQAALKG
jgi:hypothetical protein